LSESQKTVQQGREVKKRKRKKNEGGGGGTRGSHQGSWHPYNVNFGKEWRQMRERACKIFLKKTKRKQSQSKLKNIVWWGTRRNGKRTGGGLNKGIWRKVKICPKKTQQQNEGGKGKIAMADLTVEREKKEKAGHKNENGNERGVRWGGTNI